MQIFQVMVDDRHTDTEALPFLNAHTAVDYAKRLYHARLGDDELEEDMGEQEPPEGWLYYAVYSTEGDCIWVVPQELDRAG